MGAKVSHWLKQGSGSFVGLLLGASLVTVVNAHNGPIAQGVIHACINNNSGTFKLTTPTGVCAQGETPLDWNAQGPPGISGWEVIESDRATDLTASGGYAFSTAVCPTGKKVIGGGSQIMGVGTGGTEFHRLHYSRSSPTLSFPEHTPNMYHNAWIGEHYVTIDPGNPAIPQLIPDNNVTIRAYAICANVAP